MATPRKARGEQPSAMRSDDLARAQRSAMALRLAVSIKATSPHALQASATDGEPDAERESEGDGVRAGHKTPTGRRRSTPTQQDMRTPRKQTPKEQTPERDDGSLSVLSSDASPSESVFEFLNSTDASGLALFTPPPQIQTRTTRSMSLASISSPGASGSRHSSAASSPSQFFRSPVRTRKSSTGHSKPPLATPSPASTRMNRTPRRPRSARCNPVAPLEARIKEEILPSDDLLSTSARAAADLLKPELTDDLSSLSPWPRLTTTPKRPASGVRTSSPSLRHPSFPLSRRLKDAFDEAEVLDVGESRRNSLDGTADDLFSAAPSGLHGSLSDHDSFFSFASSLSPLANAEELEASFLSVRLSPMTSFGSYELPRLLPTIPTSRLEGNLEEEKAAATPTKTQPPRQVSHGPSNLSGKSPAVSFMETSFPNIKALTSATPGKNQRSQLQSHSIMMTTLHSPFEAVSLSSTRDFQAINNSLKRKGQGRKRKLEDKRSGSNVQRKLLHTPVKASPLRTLRSPLHPLNGRMPHRSFNPTSLPSLDKDEDEGRDGSASALGSSADCVQQLNLETPVKTPSSQKSKKRRAPDSPGNQQRRNESTPKLVNVLQHRRASTSPGFTMTTPVVKSSFSIAPSDSTKQPFAGAAASAPMTPMVLPIQTPIKEEVAQTSMPVPPIITAMKPKKAPCNCKKSKCLKLYCECFASGGYCDESCNCIGCSNTPATETERQEAINARLEKNPNAFKPKIEATVLSPNSAAVAALAASTTMMVGGSNSVHAAGSAGAAAFLSPLATQRLLFHHSSGGVKKMHKHGCHCKKSACQKKYCECFQAGVPCGDNCRCMDCKNQAPCVAHASPAVSSVSAMTPSREIDETFVSPVLQGVRKRLRIDRETWAKNFSSPYESSPTSLRERTERFRSRLQAVTHATTPLKAVAGVSATSATPLASNAGNTGSLSVRLKPIPTPVPSTPVCSTPKRARLTQSSALSPLTDVAPRATSDTITSSNKSRELAAVSSLAGGHKLKMDARSRVFVLPLFGDKLPPLRMSVSAAIFRFLTNADLHNASLVNRLWNQVALGDSVWDHANFVPAGQADGDNQAEQDQASSLTLRAAAK